MTTEKLMLEALIASEGFQKLNASEDPSCSWARFKIPARHEEVGPLRIAVASDEYTVYTGEMTHSHIGIWEQPGETDADRARNAAESLVDFIHQILLGQVLFRVRRHSVTTYNLSHVSPPDEEDSRDYLWSGPLS